MTSVAAKSSFFSVFVFPGPGLDLDVHPCLQVPFLPCGGERGREALCRRQVVGRQHRTLCFESRDPFGSFEVRYLLPSILSNIHTVHISHYYLHLLQKCDSGYNPYLSVYYLPLYLRGIFRIAAAQQRTDTSLSCVST